MDIKVTSVFFLFFTSVLGSFPFLFSQPWKVCIIRELVHRGSASLNFLPYNVILCNDAKELPLCTTALLFTLSFHF